jgi:hypothetical protein
VQGGLKLKISMKVPRREDLDKLRCDRTRRLLPRRSKSRAAKVITLLNVILIIYKLIFVF